MVFPKQAEVLISGILDGNDAEIGIFNVIHLEKQVVGKKSHFLLLQSLSNQPGIVAAKQDINWMGSVQQGVIKQIDLRLPAIWQLE